MASTGGMSLRKKALLVVVIVLLGTFAAMGLMWWTTFGKAAPLPATGNTVGSSGHIVVNEGYVASYIVPVGNGQAVLVDCGLAEDGNVVKTALANAKLTAIGALVTHGHPDHVGGCNALGVPVTALNVEVPGVWGDDDEFYQGPIPHMAGAHKMHVKVAQPVDDGATVTFGEKSVRVLAIPGHTKGSAGYLVDGVLYFGDTAGAAKDGSVSAPPAIFSDDVDQGVSSLKALAQRLKTESIPVTTFAFSHSGPMPADLAKLEAVE